MRRIFFLFLLLPFLTHCTSVQRTQKKQSLYEYDMEDRAAQELEQELGELKPGDYDEFEKELAQDEARLSQKNKDDFSLDEEIALDIPESSSTTDLEKEFEEELAEVETPKDDLEAEFERGEGEDSQEKKAENLEETPSEQQAEALPTGPSIQITPPVEEEVMEQEAALPDSPTPTAENPEAPKNQEDFETVPVAKPQTLTSIETEEIPVRTWISVKKIRTEPFYKNNILANRVYLVRPSDTLETVAQKIYGSADTGILLKINPHFKRKTLKVGDKVYYRSPLQPGDNQNLLTYYEENNIRAERYIGQKGENLRQIAQKLLGHKDSWKELWASNLSVESKGVLAEDTPLKYWPQGARAPVVTAEETPPVEPYTETEEEPLENPETTTLAQTEPTDLRTPTEANQNPPTEEAEVSPTENSQTLTPEERAQMDLPEGVEEEPIVEQPTEQTPETFEAQSPREETPESLVEAKDLSSQTGEVSEGKVLSDKLVGLVLIGALASLLGLFFILIRKKSRLKKQRGVQDSKDKEDRTMVTAHTEQTTPQRRSS